MKGTLLLNAMQSFDFDNETAKQSAATTADNYTLLELSDGQTVGSQGFRLTFGDYGTLAATELIGSGTAIVNGNLELTLSDVSADSLYLTNTNTISTVKIVGIVTLTVTNGTFRAMFVGGVNSAEAEVSAVAVTLNGTTISTAFYGNGMSTNLGNTNISLTGVNLAGYFYGGTGSYNADYSTGVIVVNFNSGTYSAQIYGGSRVGGDGGEALDSVNEIVTLNLTGGLFSNYIFAGGCGVGGNSAGTKTITSTVSNGTYVNLIGAVVNHEIYAGGFGAAGQSGTAINGAAEVNGGTTVVAKAGSVVNLYGGGYCSGESSVVNGGSSLNIRGFGFREGTASLSVGTVFGGGNGSSPAAAGSSVVNGGSSILIGGNTLTVNTISVTNVYGGGNGAASVVNDGSTITFSGNFSGTSAGRLSVTGVVSGSGRNGGVVNGTRLLQFDDFQGTLDARLSNFDKVVTDGYTQAVFTRAADFSGVADMHFDFSQSEPLSSDDTVMAYADGVTFGEDMIFSLEFQARAAMETSYTLIWSYEDMNIEGKTYKLTDSLYGDTFTAKLGDGATWNYYGYEMSMTFEPLSGNNTLVFNCYKTA
ncbi:MAG: hypothetical protein AB7F40_05845 [Victivallaceae bacterium]|nr:hypothetical protein [Victivallaceae bacterium]